MRLLQPLFFALLLLAAPSLSKAQTLPLDEHGKVSFYDIVKADSLPASLLYAHAKSWLSQQKYKVAVADSAGGRLVGSGAFGMFDRGYITKKLHGKVNYQVTIEVKEGRYRLQINNMVFAYYQEDHSYHLVPTGKIKPLEDRSAAGWQKLWESHRKNALLAMTSLSAELKTAMLAVPKVPAPVAQSRSSNW